MNQRTSRLISILLVLCLTLSLLPGTAWAADISDALEEPQVESLTVSWNGGQPVELLGLQPTVSIPEGEKPVFTVKFDKTDIIDQVFVTSTKDGKTEYLEALPKSTVEGMEYVTAGYFDKSDENYIPGTIAVTYSKKTATVNKTSLVAGAVLTIYGNNWKKMEFVTLKLKWVIPHSKMFLS